MNWNKEIVVGFINSDLYWSIKDGKTYIYNSESIQIFKGEAKDIFDIFKMLDSNNPLDVIELPFEANVIDSIVSNHITYKELLIKLSKKENFCHKYTLKHLTVDECFNSYAAFGMEWDDVADKESIEELNK